MTASAWPSVLTTLLHGEALTADEAAWAMEQVMAGAASPAQIAGLAVALRAKGEQPVEVAGLVETMLAHASRCEVPGPAVDTCGTGGDRAHTVNISTMSALVVAATGARVVKHGNRAASSSCGSADLLEALGVAVDLPPDAVAACVAEVGIGFCFAPVFHPALRHAAQPRRDLGVATVFNFLGPLTNPASPAAQAVGVADARMAGVMAAVLAARGTSALVFRGEDGLDELTTTAPSRVWLVRGGDVAETVVKPEAVGLARVAIADLRGGDPSHNADVARRLVAGEPGAVRDAVLLNAAAALVALDGVAGDAYASGEASGSGDELAAGLAADLRAGMSTAAQAVDSGAATRLLDRWVAVSRRLATG
ncbi:MAG: anthranilate phosphoribosyltransferase [Actinomycetota bacterium]|nr:anthranilate phosphoribosyltransferase [Actinomycetota bacterium]